MLPHVTKCHITPIPCHTVLICDMAVRHTNSFEDYELRLPTTFKGSFPSHPPLSLPFPPPPPTVRVRQREGWRVTGKRESLVRRLLLSFLVCLCGWLIFQKGPRNRWSKANCSIFKISRSEAGIFSR